MTTFILKKYDPETTDKKPEDPPPATTNEVPGETSASTPETSKATVVITGTISEIVAAALYKALARQVDITKTEESVDASLKAVSTEEINTNPVDALSSVNPDDVLFISNAGFSTTKEEWFLTNIANKTNKVIYTVEGLINYVKRELDLS